MQFVDDVSAKTNEKPNSLSEDQYRAADQASCINATISLINNVVETACEREPDLDLMRLVNFMDLYRIYLQLASQPESDFSAHIMNKSATSDAVLTQKLGNTELVSFECFVRDCRLLTMTASAASRESGEKVTAPPPLTSSANG